MFHSSRNQLDLVEQLMSDDELPNDFIDIPEIPAYLNENRFDNIKFKWIDNWMEKPVRNIIEDEYIIVNKLQHNEAESSSTKELPCKNIPKCNDKLISINGILKQKDVLCIKHLIGLIPDSMLLWFVDFLIKKDFQANFYFLRSCLVYDDSGFKFDNRQKLMVSANRSNKTNIKFVVKKKLGS